MKIFLSFVIIFCALNASADYFKAGLGYSVGGTFEVESPAFTQNEDDLKNMFLSPILVAYGFEIAGDVHGEVELAYSQSEFDINSGGNEKPTVLTVGMNLVGNAPLGSVILTGGAGITYGNYDSDASVSVGPTTYDIDSGSAFGLQLFGGLDFPISESVSLGAEFRYMTTVTKIDLEPRSSDVEGTFQNTSVLFNVKFGM